MKLLYVTNIPAPYKVEFFKLLSKRVELTVAYEREKASDRDNKWYADESSRAYREVYLRGVKVGADTSCSLGVVGLLRREKFDAVIMNGFSSPTAVLTIAYMRARGISYGIMCDGMTDHAESRFKACLKRHLISGADYCLSSNSITSDRLKHFGAKGERIHRYPFSSVSERDIERDLCDKREYKSKIGCSDEKILLYVGQFIHRKGLDVLMKSYAKLKSNVRLILVGGSADSLRDLCGLADKRITVCDFMTKSELDNYYKAADVFVLPTREDVWGLVVNEALSRGLPVVTTDNCGAGVELIRDGVNGYVVPVGDENSLAEKIDTALENCEEMRASAIEVARYYTVEKMAETTCAILERVMKKC